MYRSQHQIDDASLQADVMRFMAIVAFCLVAIMAMVRNVEAPPTPVETPPPEPTPVAEAPPLQKPEPTPAPPPVTKPPEPVRQVVTVTRPEVVEPIEDPAPEPEPIVETIPAPETPAPAPPEPAEEEGLTLRFASDADFLRLVTKGRVTVYAFNEATVLRLNDAYQFEDAPAPGDVYELNADTIPNHMRRTLPPDAASAPLTWAVGLSPRIRRQLDGHLATVTSGSLLINRYEEVRHVAAN